MPPPFLTRDELRTQTWVKLRAYLEGRVEELRVQNDNLQSKDIDTAIRRGRIDELKALLAMAGRLLGPDPAIAKAPAQDGGHDDEGDAWTR